MHARVRELIDYARQCGFELDGLDGNGHYVLTHANGSTVRLPSSPGDYRGDRNACAEMRRKSGVTPPRARAGKHRKAIPLQPFIPTDERVESVSAQWARLAREHRRIESQVEYLRDVGDVDGARPLVARLVAIEDEQRALGREPSLSRLRRF